MGDTAWIDKLIDQFAAEFTPAVTHYPTRGNGTLEYYAEDADCYAEWIDSRVTLYRAFDDQRIVGFSVAGVPPFL